MTRRELVRSVHVLVPLAALLLGGAVARAEGRGAEPGVKLRVRPNGVKVIYNESPRQHQRRVATHLLPVPEPDLVPIIRRHAARTRLDPRLVRAVIQVESGYNSAAISDRGAMGLMQLLPETASELAVADIFDPEDNVRGGTSYLRSLLDRFDGHLELALAAYNAGPSTVDRFSGIPPYPETRDYVRKVLHLYQGKEVRRAPVAKGPKPYLVRKPGERPLLTNADPASKKH